MHSLPDFFVGRAAPGVPGRHALRDIIFQQISKNLLTTRGNEFMIISVPQDGGDNLVAKKKPGPKPEHPKNFTLRVRVDKITLDKLDNSAQQTNSNRSDIVRQGIDLVDEKLQNK